MVRIDITSKWNGPMLITKGKKVASESSYEIGLVIEGQAKLLAARKCGYLAASINTQTKEKGTNLENPSMYRRETPPANYDVSTFRKINKPMEEGETLVGTAVDYSWYQEFGTVKMDAQPFLRPAMALSNGEVLKRVEIESKKYFLDYLMQHEAYLRSRGK